MKKQQERERRVREAENHERLRREQERRKDEIYKKYELVRSMRRGRKGEEKPRDMLHSHMV
jgi:hypothetical protein